MTPSKAFLVSSMKLWISELCEKSDHEIKLQHDGPSEVMLRFRHQGSNLVHYFNIKITEKI